MAISWWWIGSPPDCLAPYSESMWSTTNRRTSRTTSSAPSDQGSAWKNPCPTPATSTYSTSLPHSSYIRRAYSTFRSLSTSRSPATTSTGASPRPPAPAAGASGPAGLIAGWSLVAPQGSASRQYLSHVSVGRNASGGHSGSARVRASPAMAGARRAAPRMRMPATRLVLPNLAATWCAMLPPAESPLTKAREKSAASASQGSWAACARSQAMASAPSSCAAERDVLRDRHAQYARRIKEEWGKEVEYAELAGVGHGFSEAEDPWTPRADELVRLVRRFVVAHMDAE
ncbi:putative carboxylesterase 15 [Panicum miliaceum]|uniref:Carboxylesterase 15 n=1 Tax=Panicum miliaceum TaxID=4540 RepID=A0A3L6T568_PANMI|nr:putative carboxylesterase 15 [Panicum miliaceum]